MRNTLRTAWQDSAGCDWWGDRPRRRLVWLAGAILVGLATIGGRLAYVQTALPDGLTRVFAETTESFEDIPARDGRILSADGVPLADNEERYDLLVYYRWLEEPPNDAWLRHRAYAQLSRGERRQPARVEAARQAVLQRRNELWQSLADLTQVPLPELQARCRRIQHRVEQIWERVQTRRLDRDRSNDLVQTPPNLWERFWHEITTPPPRNLDDPLVIAEQEDDHVLLKGLDADIAAEIESHPERYPGVRVVLRTRRVYPQHDLAVHLLGVRTPWQPDEGETPQALQPGDVVGRSGLERSYDELLRGRSGLKRIVRNRRREILRTEIVREPRAGNDLVLTFDTTLQRRSEQLLDRVLQQSLSEMTVDDESNRPQPPDAVPPRGACLVALDVQTGAVLTAACAPRFDANLLVQPDAQRWQELLHDPRRPLFPRSLQMALPPGSTFKTLSAIALIEDGNLDPQAPFFCQGYLDRPDKDRCLVFRHYGVGHSEINLADALGRSCNVYFFTAARQAGPRPLIDWARKLGIGQPTGIDVPGEAAGRLPTPDDSAPSRGRGWYPGDTLGLVIGQSSLLVTPLQMARLMAAVANGGKLVTPYLAAGTEQVHSVSSLSQVAQKLGNLDESPEFARPVSRPIAGLHPETLAAVREGLERVVHDRQGTGYKTVRLPNVRIAGKTGTAEVGGRLPDHAWFAGYVPADSPRVAFVVVIEHGGSGGKVAGPVAREFVKLLLEHGVIAGTKELARE